MKALKIAKRTKVEDLRLSEVAKPSPKPGWILIKNIAFGLNHAEVIFRAQEIGSPKFPEPRIIGIECVGIVEDGGETDLEPGTRVIALMGGMGRSFDGSYAEYVLVPRKNVFRAQSTLDSAHLAAVPETFFTAWGSLFECLQLKAGDRLMIRGATSALGQTAILIGKTIGARIIATARNNAKEKLLKSLGVDEIIVDPAGSLESIDYCEKADKILDLIGAASMKDSLKFLNPGGIVCVTGTLGGKFREEINPINDIPNGCYLTGFYSNYPTQEKVDEILNFIDLHHIVPPIGKIYNFEDVTEYSRDLEEGKIGGKGVVIIR
ncbi:zinc-binding dehydrogenase [Candidatus Saccharibacteria bacterium]|nr:zinc-binding dehydrogenase [Candidatus Saccharibacteria bacterium]